MIIGGEGVSIIDRRTQSSFNLARLGSNESEDALYCKLASLISPQGPGLTFMALAKACAAVASYR